MVNRKLWGLTLLERNIRELEKLGIAEVIVATTEGADPLAEFCHPVPDSIDIAVTFIREHSAWQNLQTVIAESAEGVIVISGHALNDRRILTRLVDAKNDCAVFSGIGKNPAGAMRVSKGFLAILKTAGQDTLVSLIRNVLKQKKIRLLDLSDFDPYIDNLRREIPPYLFLIENEEQLKEADEMLRQTVHKGVLEFVAKYIHPPLEFGTVKYIAPTRITPNQITILWLILAAITIPLFMKGYLLTGIILAAVSGVLDGVDGKLARLTLRFSKSGDMLDHIGGTVYDAVWYLALGWYFSKGELHSTAAQFTYVLVVSYLFHRTIPGLFRKLHGKEIYDYEKIDVMMRLIGSRMNNNIWLLLIGIGFGFARETYYVVCLWMLVTAVWYIFRFLWVSVKSLNVNRKIGLTSIS